VSFLKKLFGAKESPKVSSPAPSSRPAPSAPTPSKPSQSPASPAQAASFLEAAKTGDLGSVKSLFKDNPSLILSKDREGSTAFMLAAWKGNKDVTEWLLVNNADVNAKSNDGSSALHCAANDGRKDIAELLIAKGADINAKDKRSWTPLAAAARQRQVRQPTRCQVPDKMRYL
jgi:ankyrin repeat protein